MFQYILISISLESTYWKLDGVPGENGTQWLILRCTLLKLTTDSLAVKQNIKSLAKKKKKVLFLRLLYPIIQPQNTLGLKYS